MKILHFPARRPIRPPLSESLGSVQALLDQCLERQVSMREEGRRLRTALRRLQGLMGEMQVRQSRLGRSLRRLRAVQARRPFPEA